MGDITDPLRSLELEDTEDIFKTEFKGSVGRYIRRLSPVSRI